MLEALDSTLITVRERVEAAARCSGRTSADVQVLAATKYVDSDGVAAMVAAGVDGVAENRLESLIQKQVELGDRCHPVWHYIGRLQSRKVVDIASRVSMIHTLASESAAARLDQMRQAGHVLPQLLVQVNVDGDATKDGIPAADVTGFLESLPPTMTIAGFMTMPAFAGSPEESRATFRAMRRIRDEQAECTAGRHQIAHLSMGTSQDWEVAIEEGATLVRLGRVLYAPDAPGGGRAHHGNT